MRAFGLPIGFQVFVYTFSPSSRVCHASSVVKVASVVMLAIDLETRRCASIDDVGREESKVVSVLFLDGFDAIDRVTTVDLDDFTNTLLALL